MACVHLSNGIDATSFSDDPNSLLGKLTVAGVTVSHVSELILSIATEPTGLQALCVPHLKGCRLTGVRLLGRKAYEPSARCAQGSEPCPPLLRGPEPRA